eukprot:scaffold1516_cov230-Pinguiococcus_pyrenoidosus.AAC.11
MIDESKDVELEHYGGLSPPSSRRTSTPQPSSANDATTFQDHQHQAARTPTAVPKSEDEFSESLDAFLAFLHQRRAVFPAPEMGHSILPRTAQLDHDEPPDAHHMLDRRVRKFCHNYGAWIVYPMLIISAITAVVHTELRTAELHREIDDQSERLDVLEEQLRGVEDQSRMLSKDVEALHMEVGSLETDLNRLNDTFKSFESQIENLQAIFEEMEAALPQMNDTVTNLQTRTGIMKEDLGGLDDYARDQLERLDHISDGFTNVTVRVSGLETRLSDLTVLSDELHEGLSAANTSVAAVSEEQAIVVNTQIDISTNMTLLLDAHHDLASHLDRLGSEVSTVNGSASELQGELANLNVTASALRREQESHEARAEELADQLTEAEAAKDDLLRAQRGTNETISAFSLTLMEREQTLGQLVDASIGLNMTVQVFEDRLARMRVNITSAEADLRRLQEMLPDYEQTVQNLTEAVGILQTGLENITDRIEDVEQPLGAYVPACIADQVSEDQYIPGERTQAPIDVFFDHSMHNAEACIAEAVTWLHSLPILLHDVTLSIDSGNYYFTDPIVFNHPYGRLIHFYGQGVDNTILHANHSAPAVIHIEDEEFGSFGGVAIDCEDKILYGLYVVNSQVQLLEEVTISRATHFALHLRKAIVLQTVGAIILHTSDNGLLLYRSTFQVGAGSQIIARQNVGNGLSIDIDSSFEGGGTTVICEGRELGNCSAFCVEEGFAAND